MSRHVARRDPDQSDPFATSAAGAATVAVVGLIVAAVVLVLVVLRPGALNQAAVDQTTTVAGLPTADQTLRGPSALKRRATEAKVAQLPPGPASRGLVRTVMRQRLGPTTFRIASFNILGASHTAAGGRHARFAPGSARLPGAVALLNGVGASVAGLQEFQPSQIAQFRAIASQWAIFPGPGYDRQSAANSIVYRTDVWELLESHLINVPYFGGRPVAMPYIKLRHLQSEQEIWVFNTHNPADAHGPAQRFRDAATAIQVDLANRLTKGRSSVFFTGDMNDRERYFCPFTTQTKMKAANGGSTGSSCAAPPNMDVDWIFGSDDVSFTRFASVRDGLVERVSDHPFIWAEAILPEQIIPLARRN